MTGEGEGRLLRWETLKLGAEFLARGGKEGQVNRFEKKENPEEKHEA